MHVIERSERVYRTAEVDKIGRIWKKNAYICVYMYIYKKRSIAEERSYGEFREEILIGSASAAESRSSRRLSTEVYLTRIQTRKSPPPLSQSTHSLTHSLSPSFLVGGSLRSRSIRSEVRPRALRRVHTASFFSFPRRSLPHVTLSRASRVRPRSRKLRRRSRYQGQGKKPAAAPFDFLLFRPRILRSRGILKPWTMLGDVELSLRASRGFHFQR